MAKEVRPHIFMVIVTKKRGNEAIVGTGIGFVINKRANGNYVLLFGDHLIRGKENFYHWADRISGGL
jgi:hypothetical protein